MFGRTFLVIITMVLSMFIDKHLLAQTSNATPYFKNFTEKEGLSSNFIRCFYQDRQGYMWIGTAFGLNRFDGTVFDKFLKDPNNTATISSNVILCITADQQNNIWIGTEGGGLNMYNPQTKKFIALRHNPQNSRSIKEDFINSLYADDTGNLWIGYSAQGWSKLHIATGAIQHFTSGKRFINRWGQNSCNHITGFVADKKGNLWISSGYGLIKQHLLTHKVEVFFDNNKDYNAENHNLFTAIRKHDDNTLWLGTWGAGLKLFNTGTQQFRSYRFQANNPFGANRNIVLKMFPKSATELWIASADKGLGIFNITTQQFNFFEHQATNKYSPLPRECRVVYADDNNNLWAGFDKGFSLYAQSNQRFSFTAMPVQKSEFVAERQVQAMYYDTATSNLYAGFDLSVGLMQKDIKTGKVSIIPFRGIQSSPSGNHSINMILPVNRQTLLLHISNKFYHFNTLTQEYKPAVIRFNQMPVPVSGYPTNPDPKGHFWIGDTNGAYYKVDGKSLFVICKGGKDNNQRFPLADDGFIVFDAADSLVWCTSRQTGLVQLNPLTNTIDSNFMVSGLATIFDVKNMIQVSKGEYWMTTYSSGIYHMWQGNNGKYAYKHYGEAEGLPDLFTNYIVQDKNDNIWLTTRKGLVQFNPQQPVFKNYNDDNGYIENWYLVFGCHLATNGNLFVGVLNGIVETSTTTITTTSVPPKVLIRQFNLFEKPWNDSVDINAINEIRLAYQQNFISIVFTALSYVNANQNQYAYKLEGVDANWIYSGNRNFVSYAGLKPGKYVLRLKAANSDGVWNETGKSITIIIDAPFWQKTWFIVLVLLILVCSVLVLYRYRIQTIRKEEKLKTTYNKKVAEIEMKALRAQMNPHFIFNCLNSINRYIVKSDHVTASGYLTRFAKLIRLILDSSSADYTPLEKEIQLLQLYVEMESLRFEDRFDFTIDIAHELDVAAINIPSMIIQPYVENAIWHGLLHKEGKGVLTIRFKQATTDLLKVEIEDDGIGRQKAAELKSKQLLKEKSYGLKITGDRIKIVNELYGLQASSNIEDLKDEYDRPAGTRVHLLLPIEKPQ
jgi:ligand-binding sensor domain-containing protein